MAIAEVPQGGPLALPGGTTTAVPTADALGVFARPRVEAGWKAWVTGVDHKKVGVMYGASALFFFLVGGLEALLVRAQLAVPDGKLISADLYNQAFTMHGVTMVFLVIMPMGAAFMNYLMPLQIGARDVAFPRLNALSFWTFLAGGIFLNTSWILGGAPDGGWFAYAPNTNPIFSPSHGMDFYAIGLLITGVASTLGAINLVVTVLNLRAPGMTMFKMPVFTWMGLVTQFLIAFAMPVITVALFLLTFDRLFDSNFFNVREGADPLLWEHLFWVFGHPEVYILILPAFGIISEIIPVFSRKPLFGYPFMVFSGIAIGFMGWGVWAHHMFASGIGPISVAAFSVSTMFIAVPTGVKIFNWMATLWGGKLSFPTAMKFAVSLVAMFTIGGLSGVTHAISPSDLQQTDTYYIVAHFHYVIFGGALLGFLGGFYFWWPKVFGHKLSESLGSWHFWLTIIGMNLTFGPMHIVGLLGQPRRTATYQEGYGFEIWNQIETVGSFIIALSALIFVYNIGVSYRRYVVGGRVREAGDPWDARSLEWMTPNPTPHHNFDEIPTVTHQDEFWHRKYAEDERGRPVAIAPRADVVQSGDARPHLPSQSYWPIALAVGLPIVGYGLIFNLAIAFVGGAVVITSAFGWCLEPAMEKGHGDHGDDHVEPVAPDAPDGDAIAVEREEAPVG
jgi:cytochrome c oxidase subunit 1